MGIGDLIRGNKNRLPDSQINEVTALNILMNGAPFIVTLPITQIVQTSNGHGVSVRVGFYRQTFYKPPTTETRFRKVITTVVYDPEGITIKHAMPNGQHVIVNPKAIARVTKYSDGVAAELTDGTRYVFAMDKDIQKQWKDLGFNPIIPITVFYNILQIQDQLDKEAEIEQKAAQKQAFQQAMIERHAEMDRRAAESKLKREQEIQARREKERQAKLEKQQQKEKEKQQALEKQQEQLIQDNKERIRLFDEFYGKIKTLKETHDIEAISQEEYDELKSNFINEIMNSNIPEDVNSLAKLKESKELLDMGAITQDEFDKLKSKFLNQVNNSTSSAKGVESTTQESVNAEGDDEIVYKKKSSVRNIEKYLICPSCGEITPVDENRCQSCDLMINKFMLIKTAMKFLI